MLNQSKAENNKCPHYNSVNVSKLYYFKLLQYVLASGCHNSHSVLCVKQFKQCYHKGDNMLITTSVITIQTLLLQEFTKIVSINLFLH